MLIHVSAFQPFESRRGVDTVLALRFRYDPELIEVLKDSLRRAARELDMHNVGGWLAEHRCWFVEREAWPYVRAWLTDRGCRFQGEVHDEEPRRRSGAEGAGRNLPDVQGAVKAWYREMSMRFHPDRTLDNGAAMKAINHGYERLQELLGVTR
jgi:hypothetical protein